MTYTSAGIASVADDIVVLPEVTVPATVRDLVGRLGVMLDAAEPLLEELHGLALEVRSLYDAALRSVAEQTGMKIDDQIYDLVSDRLGWTSAWERLMRIGAKFDDSCMQFTEVEAA